MTLINKLIESVQRSPEQLKNKLLRVLVKKFKSRWYDEFKEAPKENSIENFFGFVFRKYTPDDVIRDILNADPTRGKYANWIISVYLDEILSNMNILDKPELIMMKFYEDMPKVDEYLELFDKYKDHGEMQQKDINQYKSLDELYQAVKPFKYSEAKSFDEYMDELIEDEDYTLYEHPESEFDLYIPHTEKGACVLGTQTEWCTAWGEHSTNPDYKDRDTYFDSYSELAVFIDKGDPDIKYQLELDSRQFMDVDDRPFDVNKVLGNDPLYIKYLESKLNDNLLNKYFEDRGGKKYIIADEFMDTALSAINHIHITSSIAYMLVTVGWDNLDNNTHKIFNKYTMKYMLSNKKIMAEFYPKIFYYITDKNNKDEFKKIVNSYPINEFVSKLYRIGDYYNSRRGGDSHIYNIEPLEKLLKIVRDHMEIELKKGFEIENNGRYSNILLSLISSYGKWRSDTFDIDFTRLRQVIDYNKLSSEIKSEFK